MAIHDHAQKDVRKKASLEILNKFSDEEHVGFYFTQIAQLTVGDFDSIESLKNALVGLADTDGFLEKLETFKVSSHKAQLPKNKFLYIKSENRKLLFFINFFKFKYDSFNTLITGRFNRNTDPYLLLIYIMSMPNLNADFGSFINDAENSYEIFKVKRNEKYFDDNNFVNWAYDYFLNNVYDRRYFINTCTDENKKDYILSLLDFICLENKPEYEITFGRLKNAWNQKKFKDSGKEKKDYHLPLTKKTKSELTQLSEIRNCSEAKVLEDLIKNAYKLEYCDENGKPKY